MEAENNLIDNIHFRRIRKSTDHMSKYYQKNQQCFYVVKMIIPLPSFAQVESGVSLSPEGENFDLYYNTDAAKEAAEE